MINSDWIFREAVLADIPQIQVVRHLVKENTLSNPLLVTDEDVAIHLTRKGKGWVCVAGGTIIGFSIADLETNSIWALFVDPMYENQGIGKKLHRLMLNWYFSQTQQAAYLGTAPDTRAEEFYKRQGWIPVGFYGNGEVKFEMIAQNWIQ